MTSIGCLLLLSAVVVNSPWLGTAAAIISSGGLMIYYGGWTALRELWTVWLLLWMAVPLPGTLHDDLIRLLQAVTAYSASAFLELVGLAHVLQGFVFVLPDRELFVAEACSGIHSQFVLIAAAALLLVICHRHLMHGILLLTAAAILSAIINTGRVITVVTAAAWLDVDLSSGWPHQLIGYVAVLLGFGLLISTDRLLLGLLAPVMAENRLLQVRATDWLARCWNFLFAPPETAHPAETEGPDEVTPEPAQQSESTAQRLPQLMNGLTFCFLAAGLLQLGTLVTGAAADERSGNLELAVAENWLPKTLGDWQCVSYESQERDRNSDNGQFGNSWRYRAGLVDAAVSVDYPFLGWHELTDCYRSLGWKESTRRVSTAPDATGRPAEFVEVQLTKPTGERALLMFSLFDGLRQPVAPLTSPWKAIGLKLEKSPVWSILGGRSSELTESLVSVQIQLFVPVDASEDPNRRDRLRNSFIEFRNRIHDQWTRQASETPPRKPQSAARLLPQKTPR